mgnify:CR=1 FL=1
MKEHPDIPVDVLVSDFQLKADVGLSIARGWFDTGGVDCIVDVALSAMALGLTGWVRNRMDGTVEVIATGSREHLETLRQWMEQGPPAAQVSRVDVAVAAPETFSRFEWRPTA